MKQPLENVREKINCNEYSLKEIALFYERYNHFICKIETDNTYIQFKIDILALPHILGLQHAYINKKDSKQYKGYNGLIKIKTGEVTLNDLKKNIKKNPKSEIAWKNVQRRIEYLPMFLNTLEKRTRCKIISINQIFRNTSLKGKYALFKIVNEKGKEVYPMLSLKEIKSNQVVIETFIVEDNISFLGALKEENIKRIKLEPLLSNKKSYKVGNY